MAAAFFVILAPLTGNAQNSSTVDSLEGTVWQGNTDLLKDAITTVKYVFKKDGQVTETMQAQFMGWENQREYNYRTGQWDLVLKPKITSGGGNSACTYKQDGHSIQFHCGERIWNTTIQGNRMEGNITVNQGTPRQKTVKWSIERIVSGNENKNKSNKGSLNGEIGGNEADKFPETILHPQQPQENRECIEFFTAEITRYPKEAVNFQFRGRCKYGLQDYRGAIDDFNRAIELNGDKRDETGTLHSDRGDAKFKLQNYRGAIADYDEVLAGACFVGCEFRANPYYKRGIARNIFGDKVNACEDFRKSCKLGNSAACEKVKDLCDKK